MKKSFSLTMLVLLLCGALCAQSVNKPLALTGVHVIPLNVDTLLANQVVLISDGRIVSVSSNTKIPKGYRKVDAKGKYLIPGFADMHAHLPGTEEGEYPLQQYLLGNLSKGVTTLRAMRGNAHQLALRESIRKGELLGPNLYISSPAIRKSDTLSLQNAAAIFDQWKAAGYDFIKVLSMDTALYDTLAPIMQQRGFALAGHAPDGLLARAVQAGQRSVEHLDPVVANYFKDSLQTMALFKAMKEKDVYHCPDIYWYYVYGHIMSLDELRQTKGLSAVPQSLQDRWLADWTKKYEDRQKIERYRAHYSRVLAAYMPLLKIMNDEGVKLLVSPGDGEFIVPGHSLAEEMKLFAKAGISPYHILRAASANAADFFNEAAQWGTLEKGKRADMVLLSENPLLDISHVTKVAGLVLNGRWFSKTELEQMQKSVGELTKK